MHRTTRGPSVIAKQENSRRGVAQSVGGNIQSSRRPILCNTVLADSLLHIRCILLQSHFPMNFFIANFSPAPLKSRTACSYVRRSESSRDFLKATKISIIDLSATIAGHHAVPSWLISQFFVLSGPRAPSENIDETIELSFEGAHFRSMAQDFHHAFPLWFCAYPRSFVSLLREKKDLIGLTKYKGTGIPVDVTRTLFKGPQDFG